MKLSGQTDLLTQKMQGGENKLTLQNISGLGGSRKKVQNFAYCGKIEGNLRKTFKDDGKGERERERESVFGAT